MHFDIKYISEFLSGKTISASAKFDLENNSLIFKPNFYNKRTLTLTMKENSLEITSVSGDDDILNDQPNYQIILKL